MRSAVSRALAIVSSAALLVACGDDEGTDSRSKDASGGSRDASSDAAADVRDATPGDAGVLDPARDAAAEGQGGAGGGDALTSEKCDNLQAPFDRAGDKRLVVARFVSIAPALMYRGRYDWTIELRDPSGEVIGDAELEAEAFMPAHGHGTSPITLKHAAGSARYELLDVNLFMAGKWEVTLAVPTRAGEERVEFRACPRELPDAGEGDDAGSSERRGHR